MIYITISKKGGVGKSTFSNQILSSYLFDKKGVKTRLIEIDDENKDSMTFTKTDIMNCETKPSSKIREIDMIFFSKEDVIIDVGGNKTATIFLNEMKKVRAFTNVIWFVPLGIGEQDNLNALETYRDIKKLDENAKIIFLLSRAISDDLDWEFLNFFGNKFLNTKNAICNQIKNPSYISIRASAIINNARYFQKTTYDLALNKVDFGELAMEEEDDEKREKLVFLNRVKLNAVEYIEYLKDEIFDELEKLLEK